ncbi:Quercetin 2,3-dioxygenase [Microbacterium hydrocarbonoxydans]|uniref:Quercetin 2,3-dioxygenase n=1 Tax=Microbacterium hydrocarbonoxydans TaxID=273678 RepID=A0A0M2HS41_9MICO|nr:quercetin 2,3-dioxygenase [Microbacterium hydrocarbonoxydans]KJL47288.1 Quercetin 2,3-dioxygenase [Microbacterium hydrocarbonoxydans]
MSLFPTDDPDKVPFAGILPAAPRPFVLGNGEGEKSLVFDQLFTILLTGDETEDQYGAFTMQGRKGDRIPAHLHKAAHEIFYVVDGEISVWMDDAADHHSKTTLVTGDFAYVPAGTVHAFQIHNSTKVFGVGTAGFERFFHAMGQQTDLTEPQGVYVPSFEVMRAAGEKYDTVFMPEFQFRD